MAGALDGIKVIDFGQYIAGPLAGMLMADQGADVIKVDPPGGPRWQTSANATWNRGKRGIVLDLKQPDGLATAKELINSADVVVENFRPGVMDRLGLGPKAMTESNPGLIYCSLPGFASNDPRAGVPAWEGVIGAASATYRRDNHGTATDRPVYTALPIASSYSAFQGVVSIAMALNARQRDGLGQIVEVPMFDAMFPSLGSHGMTVHDPNYEDRSLRGIWGGHFQCKDGRYVRFGGTGNQNFRQFVEAAGITSWDAENLTDLDRLIDDKNLASEVQKRAKELFLTRTAQEWEDLIAEAGSEGSICRTSQEWFEHPHALESKMVVEVDDPTYGKMLQPGIAARMSLTPGAIRSPAPAPDQHREEILGELSSRTSNGGVKPTIQEALRSALAGVKVLDLCIILAGPTLGRTLAEFGADVIKIDNPARGSTVARHNEINRGKRSILLDLKSDEGRDIFWKLLEDTDVVAENYRVGKIKQLGLGYEDVRKRKPDIVYASLNAYGHLGPWAGRPGHEQFAQAATGMDRRFGGDAEPVTQPNPINDYGTGYMGAYAVALALLHRQRTGEGQYVDAALAYTAMTLQSPYMQQFEGKKWDEPKGQDTLGSGPLHRAYQARDGWVFLGAGESDLERLAAVSGMSGIDAQRGDGLEPGLEERFLAEDVETWVARLTAVGVGAHQVVMNSHSLMSIPWVKEQGLSMTREHQEIGLITSCGPAPRLSRTPVRPGVPAPKPGADALEILEGIGMGGQFDDLVQRGIVRIDGVAAG